LPVCIPSSGQSRPRNLVVNEDSMGRIATESEAQGRTRTGEVAFVASHPDCPRTSSSVAAAKSHCGSGCEPTPGYFGTFRATGHRPSISCRVLRPPNWHSHVRQKERMWAIEMWSGAFAPATRYRICASRFRLDRPAESHTIEPGMTRRAVATIRTSSKGSMRGRLASGVPWTGRSALIGTLSGCGSIAASTCNMDARSRTVRTGSI